MKICIVNCYFKDVLTSLGHVVLELNITHSGVYDIAALLKERKFSPDLIIQKEYLGAKVILSGLHLVECKKAFWSIDTHINYFWQLYYAQLFDILFTPHKNYLQDTASFWSHAHIVRLANYARERAFVPHKARAFAMNMVARMSEHRSCRNYLAKILKKFHDVQIIDNISYGDMLSLYCNSRIIPNESLAFETNFRILEGAACGCCVVSPLVGADQDALFHPAQEILVYKDASELLSILDHCRTDAGYTEAIGHAAWERVQKEHLLKHRVDTILAAVATASSTASRDADYAHAAVCLLVLTGQLRLPCAENHFAEIRCEILKQHMHVTKMMAQDPRAAGKGFAQALAVLKNAPAARESFRLSLAVLGGGCALYARAFDASREFLEIYERLAGRVVGAVGAATERELYARWIECMRADGRCLLYGIGHSGYAQSAYDFMALGMERGDRETSWAVHLLSAEEIVKTNPLLAQGAAARRALDEPGVETNMQYIEQSLRLLDVDRALATMQEVWQQLPTRQSKSAFKKALLKKHPGLAPLLAAYIME